MAIKISGTEVISDTRALTNITSITASGTLISNIHYITPIDGTNEGGELQIQGAAGWDSWIIDSFQNILRLRTNSPNTSLVFLNNSGAGTTDLAVEGRVGVGTTAPGAPLDVVSTSTSDAFHVTNGNTYFTVGTISGTRSDLNVFQPGVGPKFLSLQSAGGNTGIGTVEDLNFKLQVSAPTIGSTVGSTANLWSSGSFTTNADRLVHILERGAAGSSWTTAQHKIARIVDAITMGYIKFGSQDDDLITFGEGTTERIRINGTGNVGIGHTAPLAPLDIRATVPGIRLTGSDNTLYGNFYGSAAGIGLSSVQAQPMTFLTSNQERFRIDSDGNAIVTGPGVLGYGTGSGGTVTQATSKTTGVTLNKTNGTITTTNAALGGGSTAKFTVTNSTVSITDVIVAVARNGNYSVRVSDLAAGSFALNLKNETGGSLSDAVIINFAVLNVSTS